MQHCRSKVVVLFVSALIAMYVGVLRGEYLCSIPLGNYQFFLYSPRGTLSAPLSPVKIKAATSPYNSWYLAGLIQYN